MKSKLHIAVLMLLILLITPSCKKVYDEGNNFSLRSKKSRITGTWRLVSMEGVERLNPNIEQYMELTKEEISNGVYKAKFTNFQEEFRINSSIGDKLYSTEGTWMFTDKDNYFTESCGLGIPSLNKQGIYLTINQEEFAFELWKILKLTNDELKLVNSVCNDGTYYYTSDRILIFEKT